MSNTKSRALRFKSSTPTSKNTREVKIPTPSSQKNVLQILDLSNVSNSSSVHSYNEQKPSKKYNQLRINLAYSEYLQKLMLWKHSKKIYTQYLQSIDQQLEYYGNRFDGMINKKTEFQNELDRINVIVDIVTQLENLENNVAQGEIFDDEFCTILNALSVKLECLCSRLQLDDYSFVDNQKNRQQLENMLVESIQIMKLQKDRHDDLKYILDTLMKSFSVLKVINDRTRDIKVNKDSVSNLVVKLSSFKLSGDL